MIEHDVVINASRTAAAFAHGASRLEPFAVGCLGV